MLHRHAHAVAMTKVNQTVFAAFVNGGVRIPVAACGLLNPIIGADVKPPGAWLKAKKLGAD